MINNKLEEMIKNRLDKISLPEIFKEYVPEIKFEKEDSKGEEYFKTDCIFYKTNSKKPALYLNIHENNYFCFECKNFGGKIELIHHFEGENYIQSIIKKMGFKFSSHLLKQYHTIFEEIRYRESEIGTLFEKAQLAGKVILTDGNWKKE